MLLVNQLKLPVEHSQEALQKKIANALHITEKEILFFEILKRSIDARKKPDLYFIYSVEVKVKGEEKVWKRLSGKKGGQEQVSLSSRVVYQLPTENVAASLGANIPQCVVVGAGPGGLFCAYLLALAGLSPVLLERGEAVDKRKEAVELFWETGKLYPNSNVQFGEGGAGTFSDGKLNTLVKDKDGRNRAVLEAFVRFGAKEEILYDAKPHIGTDVLCNIVENMREEIIRLGGQVRFQSQVTDLCVDENRQVTGVIVNGREMLPCRQLVLAIGHSARDTFQMLYEKGLPMEQKSFAVGFRVEHPQKMINLSQYGVENYEKLGAAPYKVTAKTSGGRGVYSFCMCPGGYVVNASSEDERLAVNGMSYSKRDSENANSAIIVSVGPEDFPSEHPLAGVEFQRDLEHRCYMLAEGKIPVQRYGEYKELVIGQKNLELSEKSPSEKCISVDLDKELLPVCKGDYAWADLTGLLPKGCNEAFVEGMTQFGKQIKGFDHPAVLLSGVESRTSSPVRILRNESLQSEISGVYPCGEGAGYAGGITSAAMDGMRVAEEIIRSALAQQSLTNNEK